ncbi:MAG: hypothetical protein AVO33_05630 [delta proteobacterium ML8_F1]|nr:MAG: hypothetical protein AVO33_05630 [delta proteobacterium ML8_F1]
MKNKWRREILKRRNGQTMEAVTEKSMAILENLKTFEAAFKGRKVMIFIDFGKEVQTRAFIDYFQALGCTLVIPRVDTASKAMRLYPYVSWDELYRSPFGILEPRENPALELKPVDLDVIITPGVVFDRHGYRIGYGGGFYDRLFAKTRPDTLKIAIGFDLQLTDEVPRDPYDLPVDHLVTETQILSFTK